MRRAAPLALAALALTACASPGPTTPGVDDPVGPTPNITPDPPPTPALLTPEAAGGFTVSGTLDTFDDEAGFGEKMLDDGVLALAVAIPDVCAIQVSSARYVTAEGLSVDSPAGAWADAFGPLTYNGDTGLYEAGDSGYSLLLATDAEPPEADADVVAVRLGACPI